MNQIIIGLISVAKDSRLVYKAMLEIHFQSITKNIAIMYSLKSITKRNNGFLYHLEVRKPDGMEYVEMRLMQYGPTKTKQLISVAFHLYIKVYEFITRVNIIGSLQEE